MLACGAMHLPAVGDLVSCSTGRGGPASVWPARSVRAAGRWARACPALTRGTTWAPTKPRHSGSRCAGNPGQRWRPARGGVICRGRLAYCKGRCEPGNV